MPCIAYDLPKDREADIIVVRFMDSRLSEPLRLDQQREELIELLTQVGADKKYVLDFTGVVFIITNAINNLLLVNARITREEGRLVLCHLTPRLREVFRLFCLEDTVFQVFETRDEAIAELSD